MSRPAPAAGRVVLFAYGFRPFFLCAGAYAVLAMLAWLAALLIDGMGGSVERLTTAFPPVVWHGHEMLFGYVPAVIAGFFLTAVPNWTEGEPLRGPGLAALVALWVAGRFALWYDAYLPGPLVAAVDLAFLAVLAAVVAAMLWRAGARRNLALLPIVLLLWTGNLLVHLEVLDIAAGTAFTGLGLAVDAVVLLLVVIGGRITPAFTRNALAAAKSPAQVATRPLIDRLAILSAALVLLADLIWPQGWPAAVLALAAAALNGLRMAGWQGQRTLGQPILWVLHLGYLWLVLGLAAKGVAGLGWLLPPQAALHALTIGAIGTFTLGVMSRAALGHTGRPLAVRPAIAVAYGLVSAAALVRVLAASALSPVYSQAMIASAALWIAAFGLFTALYAPILVGPRPDGKPG